MSSDLTKALRARVEFEPDDVNSHRTPASWMTYNIGARYENARLAPILERLIAVVEAGQCINEPPRVGVCYGLATCRWCKAIADLRAAVLPEGK